MKEKVIITGGTGFIGKNLIPYIAKLNAEIFVLSDNDDFYSEYKNITHIKCDLLNHNDIRKTIHSLKASHLVHMAWNVAPGTFSLPLNFEWLKSSMVLLEEFHKNQGERVVMVGTCFEYDWDYGYCREDITPISHNTLYGSSKNILRQYAFSFCNHHGMEIAWPRLFYLYGPHERPQRLLAQIICSLLKGERATVLNGETYRDYMYIKDSVKALSNLIFSDFNGVINISTGIPTRLGDIGKITAELIGRPDLLKIESPVQVRDRVVYAEVNKLHDELLFEPSYDIGTGLEETIEWWKDNL